MTPTPVEGVRGGPGVGALAAGGSDGRDGGDGNGGRGGDAGAGSGGGAGDGGAGVAGRGSGSGGLLSAFSNLMAVLDGPPTAPMSAGAVSGRDVSGGGSGGRGGGEAPLPSSFFIPDAGAPGLTAVDVMGIDTEAFVAGIPFQSPPPRVWAAQAGPGGAAGSGPVSSLAGVSAGADSGGSALVGDGTSPRRRQRSPPPHPLPPPAVVPTGGGGLPPPPPPSPGDAGRDASGGLFFSFASLLATTASAALEVLTREDAPPSAGGSDDEGVGGGGGHSPDGGGPRGVLLPGPVDSGGGGHPPPRRRRSRAAALAALLNAPDVDLSALRAAAWPGLACAPRAGVWKLLLGYAPCNAARRRTALGRKRGEYRAAVEQHCGWGDAGRGGGVEGGKSSPKRRGGSGSGGGAGSQPGSHAGRATSGELASGGRVGAGGGTSSPPATGIEDEDASTRRQVAVDVPRTCPGLPLFHVDAVAAAMERVLYVWAVRHPACGYVQGMNDLVTPFFAVFLAEHATPDAGEGTDTRRRRRQRGRGDSGDGGSGFRGDGGRSPPQPDCDGGGHGLANGVAAGDARAGERPARRGSEEGETDGMEGSHPTDGNGDDGSGRGRGGASSGREDGDDAAATGNSYDDSEDDDVEEEGAGGGGGVSLATLLSWSHLDASRLRPGAVAIAEADAYWCFAALLGSIQDHFTFAQPGIQVRVHYLSQLVHRVDRELADHLTAHGLDYMAFAFRWFNCLLMRELPFPLLVRLWDTCLAEVDGFSVFLVYVCAALLVRFRGELLDRDFQGMVMFLQALPTGEWDGRDLDMLLGQAYMWHTIFGASPGRIHRT